MQKLIWNDLMEEISGWNWADDRAHGKCNKGLEAAAARSSEFALPLTMTSQRWMSQALLATSLHPLQR